MTESVVRAILEKIPYGLYLVGAKTGVGVATIVANWIGQVSFRPVLVAVSIESDSDMRNYIERSKIFSVNMLRADSIELAKAFLKKSETEDDFIKGHEISRGANGSPFLRDALASIECNVVDSVVAGDHILFVGEVVDCILNSEGSILTLATTGWKYSR